MAFYCFVHDFFMFIIIHVTLTFIMVRNFRDIHCSPPVIDPRASANPWESQGDILGNRGIQ